MNKESPFTIGKTSPDEWLKQPGDCYLLIGITNSGTKVRQETTNLGQMLDYARGQSFKSGSLWLVHSGKRRLITRLSD